MRIEVFEGADAQFYVRFRWSNGRVFATSEGYRRESTAIGYATQARLELLAGPVVEIRTLKKATR